MIAHDPQLRRRHAARIALLTFFTLAALVSCKAPDSKNPASSSPREDELFRVGSTVVYQSDLDHWLKEHHPNRPPLEARQAALDELVKRARFTQAALDAGLADDPALRDEVSRLLAGRLNTTQLMPAIKARQEIPAERLRALYQEEIARFQSPERRQVAVLWLDSGPDAEKANRYAGKLNQAREFVLQNRDLADHPEMGFSVLGADYSQHSATRFKGGVVGWLERKSGLDPWTKAVAEIAFSLAKKGEVSETTARPEGVFLVRLMDIRPAVTRSFDAVAAELERTERARLRRTLTEEFEQKIQSSYPVDWNSK